MLRRMTFATAYVAACSYGLLFAGSAFGEDVLSCDFFYQGQQAQLGTVTEFRLHVDDQITDGCWPNPDTAKTVVELVLLKNGLDTDAEYDSVSPIIAIHGLGYGVEGQTCIAYVSLKLYKYVSALVPYSKSNNTGEFAHSIELTELWARSSVLSGSKTDFQSRIKDIFEESAEAFVLAYKKAQADTFQRCPRIKDNIERVLASSN